MSNMIVNEGFEMWVLRSNACRNCNHSHVYLPSLSTTVSYVVSNTCLIDCGCYHFIPADNLEYLEYILEERKK